GNRLGGLSHTQRRHGGRMAPQARTGGSGLEPGDRHRGARRKSARNAPLRDVGTGENAPRRAATPMALIVQKYGGTSVGSVERIREVAKRVASVHAGGHKLVVVVSAMAGETNRLLELARRVAHSPGERESDCLVASGEQ